MNRMHPTSVDCLQSDAGAAADAELQRWNQRYAEADGLFGHAPNAFLALQRERLRPGQTALCIGDGDGRNSRWLAVQGLALTAFDFSPVAVAQARDRAAVAGLQVDHRVARLEDWDWRAESFDVVAAIFVQFATPPQRAAMFEGIVRTLRPGGLLLLQGYRPEQIGYGTGGPRQVDQLYTEALLRTAFAALEIIELASADRAVDEGIGHHGMSALIDLVARKPDQDAPSPRMTQETAR